MAPSSSNQPPATTCHVFLISGSHVFPSYANRDTDNVGTIGGSHKKVKRSVSSSNLFHAKSRVWKFLEHDFLLEKLSRVAPIYIVMEGSEPPFFTRFFKWESAKSAMLGNLFQRKLALAANFENPKDRNLSTPPPMIRKLYPKSITLDSAELAPKSAAMAQLT